MQTNFADDNLNDRWKRQLIYLTEKLKCFGVIIEDISELISVICEAGLSSVIVVSPRSQSVLQLYAHFCNNIIPLLKTTSFTQNQVTYNLPFDNASFNYNAKVIFVTDEELIRQMMQNPLLSEYAIIIVEGFAEPSANTEFLLFLLKKILYSRQETKFRIVLVGSTCNPLLEKCVAFMSQPGKLSVTLPIILSALPKKDVSYFPVIKFLSTVKSIEQLLLPKRILSDCLATISTMLRHQINSNYLMIFPGVEEIDDFKFLLQQNLDEKYQIGVKSIHSGVPTHEQEKIYDELEKNYTYPSSSLIVLSTSIVDFMPKDYFHTVIDTGLIRLRFFDHENRTSRLSMVPISRSLADRRASSFSNHPSAKTTGILFIQNQNKILDVILN